jgi:hypothetical protein
MLLLAGCSFQSGATTDASATVDGEIPTGDAVGIDAIAASPACVSVSYMALSVSVCPVALPDSLVISATTSIDTEAGTSNPAGLRCGELMPGSTAVCAIRAKTITLMAGAILSAHGKKPLMLLGHTIDIEGTIDVASHVDGEQGAASDASCGPLTRPTGNGGGQGGTFVDSSGGNGGDVSGTSPLEVGGKSVSSFGIKELRGGCPGGPSSASSATIGGHGGGAVWLAVDADGTLTLGNSAVINASGASGAGGVAAAGSRGGFGGGSGGMILLKAPTITFGLAKLFADGGGGGGGAANENPGGAGGDPTMPGTGGTGGSGGVPTMGATGQTGAGGLGFPAPADQRNGRNSFVTNGASGTNGAGGGGGGPGAIWIDAATPVTVVTSPPPLLIPQ